MSAVTTSDLALQIQRAAGPLLRHGLAHPHEAHVPRPVCGVSRRPDENTES